MTVPALFRWSIPVCLAVGLWAGDAGIPPLRDPQATVEGAMDLARLRPVWLTKAPGTAWTDPGLDEWSGHIRRQMRTAASVDPILAATMIFVERSPGAVAMSGPSGGVAVAFRLVPAEAAALANAMPGDDLLIGDYRGRGRGVLAAVSRDDVLAVGPLPLLRAWLLRAATPTADPQEPLWLHADAAAHLALLDSAGAGPVLDALLPRWQQEAFRLEITAEPTWAGMIALRGGGRSTLVPLGALADLPREGSAAFLAAGLPAPLIVSLLGEHLPGLQPAGGIASAIRLDGPLPLIALAIPLEASVTLPPATVQLAGEPAAEVPAPGGTWIVQQRDGWLLAGSDAVRLAAWAKAPRSSSATAVALAELDSARIYAAAAPWLRLGIGLGESLGRDPAVVLAQVAPALAGYPDPERMADQPLPLGRGTTTVAAILPLLRLCAGVERVPGRVALAVVGQDGPATVIRTTRGWHVVTAAPRDGAEFPEAIDDQALAAMLATQPTLLPVARALTVLTIPAWSRLDGRWLPDPVAMARHLPPWKASISHEGMDLIIRESGLPILTIATGIAGYLPGLLGAPIPTPTQAPAPEGRVEEF